jgi:uncharacterized protein (UPF0303 family)
MHMHTSTDLAGDLARMALQEKSLQFDHFTADTAWMLGNRLKEAAEARQGAVAIDIQLAAEPMFYFAMPGTSPDNRNWIRRKRNVTAHFHQSSYAVGLHLQMQETTLAARYGLNPAAYAPFGGSFPIRLRNAGFIGTITVSGLPQREDHSLIVQVLATWLNHPPDAFALD